jgi:hypothetical protein
MARRMICATTKLTIRRAVADDIPQIAEMMRQVSDREHSIEAVRTITNNFKPGEFYGWLACAGSEAVGVTMLQPWKLDQNGTHIQGGYWRYLWIRPDQRGTALYPRLVFTMIAEAGNLGIDLVYGAIRRPEVAEGHLALGMEKIGEISVLVNPVRPARLLSKFYQLGNLPAAAGAVPDAAYRLYLRARRLTGPSGYITEDLPATGADPGSVLPVLQERFSAELHRDLTPESFTARYHANSDGDAYRILCVKGSKGVHAAIVYRTATRRKIRNLVIMEMGYRFSDEKALETGLFELERLAVRLDCEAMLSLFSNGRIRQVLRKAGYYKSSETYVLMKKWTGKPDPSVARNLDEWHFTFGDHDAF